jgi:hypothetical protein
VTMGPAESRAGQTTPKSCTSPSFEIRANMRRAVSVAAVAIVVVLVVAAGVFGYFLGTGASFTSSSGSSSSIGVTSTNGSVVTSTHQQLPETAGSQTYALSQREKLWLGWTLDGVYSVSNVRGASTFTLVLYNQGQDSLTNVTYSIQGTLGFLQNVTTLTPGSFETNRIMFAGYVCGTTAPEFCPQNFDLSVYVHFSDGEAFTIPQMISAQWGSGSDPFVQNTQSPYCSRLLSTVGSSYSVHFVNTYMSVWNNGGPALNVAAFVIFDPLDSNGLRVATVQPFTTGSETFVPSNPSFISGKQYSIWLQIGDVFPNVSNTVYAQGGFCTISLSFLAP